MLAVLIAFAGFACALIAVMNVKHDFVFYWSMAGVVVCISCIIYGTRQGLL